MKTYLTKIGARTVVGISVRTNNRSEMDPKTAQLPGLWQNFFKEQIYNAIPNKSKEGEIVVVYSNYKSDESDDYDYTIGAQVSDVSNIPEAMVVREIPEQNYEVFTTEKGPMPDTLVKSWMHIWRKYQGKGPHNNRLYTTDFEIYDHRAQDQKNSVVDIYIALKS